jgi:hypothetical protein
MDCRGRQKLALWTVVDCAVRARIGQRFGLVQSLFEITESL